MYAHYGYVRGTIGADGDQVDVFIGRRPDLLDRIFVIDQMKERKNKGGAKFDEHKIMLGYKSLKAALKDYRKSYGDRVMVGTITEVTLDELKQWLRTGNLNKPIAGRAGVTTYRTDAAPFSKRKTNQPANLFLN